MNFPYKVLQRRSYFETRSYSHFELGPPVITQALHFHRLWNLWQLYREIPRTPQHTFLADTSKARKYRKTMASEIWKAKFVACWRERLTFNENWHGCVKSLKKCFRHIESLIKRSKGYEEGKRGFTDCYEKTKSESKNVFIRGESDRFKSVAKRSQCLQTYCKKP